jgi:hypothetical protein
LALAACSLTLAPPAHATPVFAVAPVTATADGYFVLASTPGAVLERSVKVTNVGDSAGRVRLYAVDATTGRTTGAVYLGPDRPRQDVGAWIALQQVGLRLAPRESKTIAFTVRVPQQARGGQHLGGIVADNVSLTKEKPTKKGDGSFKINLHHLTITAVQVDLPGKPVNSIAIGGLRADGRPGYQSVLVALASRGNQMIKPTLAIQVKDDSGKKVLAKTTKLDTFLPNTRIDYPVAVLGRGLAAGSYEGTVVLRLGGKVLDRFSGSFDVTDKQVAQVFGNKQGAAAPGANLPWRTILAGLLAALLAGAAALGIRSIRRRRAAAVERARVEQEAAASRLRDLENRESGVAERERADTVRAQLLDERNGDLDSREQASTARAAEVERSERVVAELQAEATARGEDIERRQAGLAEREQAAAVRAKEIEHSHKRLVERAAEDATRRQELQDGERRLRASEEEANARHEQRGIDDAARRQALLDAEQRLREREDEANARHEQRGIDDAARRQALLDAEQRLREREDEANARHREREVQEAASRQALLEGEQRLREREDAHSRLQQSTASTRRGGNTFASRLKRRIGA